MTSEQTRLLLEERPSGDTIARRRGWEPLSVNGLALMANSGVTSAFGIVFWVLAAHLYDPAQVGRDAALISAMVGLAAIADLNLNVSLPRILPEAGSRRSKVVALAYAASACAALAVSTAFVLVAPLLFDGFAFLAHAPGLRLALPVAVALWGIFALQDAVLTATRRAVWVPVENGIFGLLKIVVIIALAGYGLSHGVFVAWVLPMLVLLVPVNLLIFRLLRGSGSPAPRSPDQGMRPGARGRFRFLAGDYLASLLDQASIAIAPILVLGAVGGARNAYFYVALTIACAVDALSFGACQSLTVEGALDPARVADLGRRAVRRFGGLLVPLVVAAVLVAPVLLRPFGADYVDQGTTVLRLLLLAVLPQSVISFALALARIEGRATRILLVRAAGFLLLLAGINAALHVAPSLTSVGLAWFGVYCCLAVIVLPSLRRALTT